MSNDADRCYQMLYKFDENGMKPITIETYQLQMLIDKRPDRAELLKKILAAQKESEK